MAPVLQLLPAVVGPLLTWLVKMLIKKTGRTIKPEYLPVISAAGGAVFQVLSNPTGALAGNDMQMLQDAITGALGGGAGSKARDLIVGKPDACAKPAPETTSTPTG